MRRSTRSHARAISILVAAALQAGTARLRWTCDAPRPRLVTGDTDGTSPSRQVTRAVIPVREDSVTEQAGPQDAVIVEDVVVRFDDQVALDGVSMTVPTGSIVGIIGPSGAGKTTLIRLLTGVLSPTSGTLSVLGEEPRRFRRETREGIGYMPQSFTLYPDLTVRENVDFVASLFGMLFFRRRKRTREVLQLLDLWDVRRRRAGKLSGGMQRRLELAGALVHDPALLFLDEPTAGLDPLLRTRVWDELRRLREAGRTLLVTTQHINEAEECDLVAMIVEGRLIALAAPDALRRQAMGGDLIELETKERFDGTALAGAPEIIRVRQDGPRQLTLTVDDAGTATPGVVAAIEDRGGSVETVRELHPSFDDVFAALVANDRKTRAARADEATADPTVAPAAAA
jgi:ABC-2 type transport system ATP-binding protein